MRSDQHRPSRLAIAFVTVGLALSAIGIAYIVYAGRPRELPALTASPDDARLEHLDALMRMLTNSFLLFLVFLIGSYLIVRIGRRVRDRKLHHERTEYVDAWGNYRLTQDEIDTAMRQLDDDFPPDSPPSDAEPRSPEEDR